jgi:hypothetical protein
MRNRLLTLINPFELYATTVKSNALSNVVSAEFNRVLTSLSNVVVPPSMANVLKLTLQAICPLSRRLNP